MKKVMQNIYNAFDLLTLTEFREEKRGGDIYPVFFPLVGLIIGLFLCLVFAIFYLFFPLEIALLFTIFAYTIVTAAKHVDDFADYVDAMLGGRTQAERREIMDDSDAGTFAIVAIFFLLVLYVATFSLFTSDIVFAALLITPMVVRWSVLYQIFEDIKLEDEIWLKRYTKYDFYIATVIVAGISFALLGWHALVLMLILALLASVVAHKSEKLIGEYTSDVRGFIVESNSILFLLGLYILVSLF